MRAKLVLALTACLGLVCPLSCSRENPAPETAHPGASAGGSEQVPEIPIDVFPKLLKAPVVYPEAARSRGEQGIVYVSALVGKDGRVIEAALDPKKPASDVLGAAAVEAVRNFVFEPARSKGEPVEVWIVVPVNFRLD